LRQWFKIKGMPENNLFNIAGWYDPIFEGLLGGLRALATRIVAPETGMRVLDIGCGTGAQLRLYQDRGSLVYGIDLAQPMLKMAKTKLGNQACLTNGNALRVPFPNQVFDLVMSSLFLHQLHPDLRTAVLNEMLRVLQPGGQLLLVDFHAPEKRSLSGNLTHGFISMIELFAGWEHFSNSRDFLAQGGIPTIAEGAGLRIHKSVVVGNGNLGIYLLRIDNN
jgi:ubiquinone/menaquinone biosynthesis C-methylase UbiE